MLKIVALFENLYINLEPHLSHKLLQVLRDVLFYFIVFQRCELDLQHTSRFKKGITSKRETVSMLEVKSLKELALSCLLTLLQICKLNRLHKYLRSIN